MREQFYQRAFGPPLKFEDDDSAVFDFANTVVNLLSGSMDRLWGLRTASCSDPGGHIWEIAE